MNHPEHVVFQTKGLPEAIQNEQRSHPKKSRTIVFMVIAIIFVFVIGMGGIIAIQTVQRNMLQKEKHVPTAISGIPHTTSPLKMRTKIVFEKEFGTDTKNSEIWIMNTDGTHQEKLPLPETNPIPLNNLSTGWVYYVAPTTGQNGATNDTIYAYNYVANQTKKITEENRPDSMVNLSNYLVSPDGKKILYDLYYTGIVNGSTLCGQQPCQAADMYPTYKTGAYVYNIQTDKKVYLGQLLSESWDMNSKSVYTTQGENYHKYTLSGGLYTIDTDTGKATLIDAKVPTNDFTYYEYPIADTVNILIDNLKNENGGSSKNGDVKIVKNGKEKIIDNGNICNFVSCLAVSPDKQYAVYTKSDALNTTTTVMLINLSAETAKALLQVQTNTSFHMPTWISPTQFIVQSNVGIYPNDKYNILSIDITSGNITPLTTSDNARMY